MDSIFKIKMCTLWSHKCTRRINFNEIQNGFSYFRMGISYTVFVLKNSRKKELNFWHRLLLSSSVERAKIKYIRLFFTFILPCCIKTEAEEEDDKQKKVNIDDDLMGGWRATRRESIAGEEKKTMEQIWSPKKRGKENILYVLTQPFHKHLHRCTLIACNVAQLRMFDRELSQHLD